LLSARQAIYVINQKWRTIVLSKSTSIKDTLSKKVFPCPLIVDLRTTMRTSKSRHELETEIHKEIHKEIISKYVSDLIQV